MRHYTLYIKSMFITLKRKINNIANLSDSADVNFTDDWISKAEEKRRAEAESWRKVRERNQKRHEEREAFEKHWYESNRLIIEEIFDNIQKMTDRAKKAGFSISCIRKPTSLMVYHSSRSKPKIELNINYKDGFVVTLTNTDGAIFFDESEIERDYAFNELTEDKISYYLRWIATGKGSFKFL